MCYEDLKLGMRRRTKITAYAGSIVKIDGDIRRVVLRVGVWSGNIRGGPNNGNQAVLVADATVRPTDEITLETHGLLVTQSFTFDGGASNGSIIEIIDPDILEPVENGNKK